MNDIKTKAIDANAEYLQLELSKLKTLIHRRILWQRNLWNDEKLDRYRGFVISDSQVDAILQNDADLGKEQEFYESDAEAQKLSKKIGDLIEKIRDARETAEKNGLFLPLPYLERVFGLSLFEYNLLILCLAPELEREFERLYGYAEDNVNRNLPSPALAMNLFCLSEKELIEARKCFAPTSPLFLLRILTNADGVGPSLSKQMQIDERIVNFIVSTTLFELNSTDYMGFVKPLNSDEFLYPSHLEELTNLIRGVLGGEMLPEKKVIINVYGPNGIGKKTLSATACNNCGFPLLFIDIEKILRMLPEKIEDNLWIALRESLLQSALPYFEISEISKENEPQMKHFERIVSSINIPIFIGSDKPWRFSRSPESNRVISIELPMIDYGAKVKCWEKMLNTSDLRDEIKRLASNFEFAPGDISKTIEMAKGIATLRSPQSPNLNAEDLWQAARNLPRHKLGELAQKLVPVYTWDDIVLSKDIKEHLKEICKQVAFQSKVYQDWGLGSKLSRGTGISALFSGKSGTGKTMAAEIIANELNLDLYRIDLSSVVSKYIGETEKNLKKVFDEAEKSNAILFFDEADALFGKRSEVKDSHDRYANIEINYLLQRMEDYKGLCILATNRREALDSAFLRRLRFTVEFPMPDAEKRKKIWRKGFEPRVPYNNVDFDFLARQFKISGGNIRNITLNAAFLAAADSNEVDMKRIMRATKREFDKIGKLCLESEFGKYYSMIR